MGGSQNALCCTSLLLFNCGRKVLSFDALNQWRGKLAKPGGANLLNRKYFCSKKLKSYGAPFKSGGAAAP